ncbi:hypothetical protein GoPhGRU1p93 [Gordonia phage GRU1]|uniref:Uncharacterized protein n=1 Tax=Gordonia phage GRU1 TaxID=1109710 RepID=G8EK52_9CAUD|nr:hypothetical protein GoPhGRU1p93 [Gordonia phage GRU1]AET09934.1 hypothetical protein [Gordonia phage GRU1]WAA19639.1 hypothetical protein SEA_DALILPOP_12 [Gordonia phage Dalilpop]
MSDTALKVAVGDVLKVRRRIRDHDAENAEKKRTGRPFGSKVFTWNYTEVTVTKVGRVYFYANKVNEFGGVWERKFRLDNGYEVAGIEGCQAFTPESLAAHERREKAEKQLNDLTRSPSWQNKLSITAVEGIVAILTAEEAIQ